MKVSCIIPAYNEGPRVGGVIKAVVGHPLVEEVIVIDDCSTDDTAEVLRNTAGIRVITHEHNTGKTKALFDGLEAARNNHVMMLDADLVGLDEESLTRLISPVLEGKADMTLSIRSNSLNVYKWLGIDFVSGERVYDKRIIGDLNRLKSLRGFGFEVFLNDIVLKKKLRLKIVKWDHVGHTYKQDKIGVWAGLKAELRMTGQVVETVGLPEIIRQLVMMRRLRV